MITKYSSSQVNYDELFDEAEARLSELGESNVEIKTLDNYFSHLRDLIYGPNDCLLKSDKPEDKIKIQNGYKFLRLPVDEPRFIINANTREIIVPEEFKKNGIAVIGDEAAEVLFFEVDRFYDAMDLAMLKTEIYWHNPSTPNDMNRTESFLNIVESNPNTGDEKLVFGWPISSNITREAGKITFSVRFYHEDEVNNDGTVSIKYSLATLPQTVFVNNGLVHSDNAMQDNRFYDILESRIWNTSNINNNTKPNAPHIVVYSDENNTIQSYTGGTIVTVDNNIVDEFKLYVQGDANVSSAITYKWYREGEPDPLTNEAQLAENLINITEAISGVTQYYNAQGVQSQSEFSKDDGYTYIKVCGYTLKNGENLTPGTYYPLITNNLNNRKKTINLEGKELCWVITGPETIDENIFKDNKEVEVNKTINMDEKYSYSWTDTTGETTSGSSFTPEREGQYEVIISNSKNGATISQTESFMAYEPIGGFTVTISQNENTLVANLNREIKTDYEEVEYVWSIVNGNVLEEYTTNTLSEAQPGVMYKVVVTIRKGSKLSAKAEDTHTAE